MMSSKREEERNEKVIRGLLKLPPNRRCINCNGLGPQYVCTNFWTFVCTACSGIHREFTHRVKSVSMAKFTAQEVEALQNGGNQRARELFLKDWDLQNMKLPDSSYPDKIREFIKNVYVEKKYVGGRSSDKPPKDPQGLMTHEEHRRASSYHSFSQSPPYDNQYEDRRYGKPRIMLTRKPGSDHGHYEGNISSVFYSPGRGREHMYEDQFANESSSSRISDYSVSSNGDPFRSSDQSQRFASLGSFGSFDEKSLHAKSANFGALPDAVFQSKNVSMTKQPNKSTNVSSETSTPQPTAMIDLFTLQFSQQQNIKTSVDLFADFNNKPSCSFPSENKAAAVPSSENDGWAMFDTVHQVAPDHEVTKGLRSMTPPCLEKSTEIIDAFSSKQDASQLLSDQIFTVHGEVTSTTNQWHTGFTEIQNAANSSSTPVWNAFDDSFQKNSLSLYANSSSFCGQQTDVTLPKVLNENSLQFPFVLDKDLPIKSSSERLPSVGLSCEVSSTQEWKSTNPFDLSNELDAEASNMFLDMSSLQSALPNSQLPNAFLDGLSQQPWFQHNSVSTFSAAIPQGIPYVGGQIPSSQLPNITSQGSATSGNPFA
ncbi:hypothetical protein M5K25_003176 [Dendrobium thyrsiflorum]|uniref:Arf-GAP domain-containing protein n=1 Tax=Dendrobium thyrsiflorum TaxID=117978 RepID=A0ABD0VVQ8_DENTH